MSTTLGLPKGVSRAFQCRQSGRARLRRQALERARTPAPLVLPSARECFPLLRMTRSCFLALLAVPAFFGPMAAAEPARDTRCYEMRVYYAAEGKLDALQARFREHTLKLFEKHGMTNIGYWTPVENPERKLVYVLGFPDRAARDASFQAFVADPEWQAVAKKTEENGRLVDKIDSWFLQAVDFSPAIAPAVADPARVFELRTYTASAGNRDRLLARFRDHTVALFTKHGMTNFAYWVPQSGQPGAEDTLVYLLAHASRDAAAASFQAFGQDPAWKAAREASEKQAGGSLTTEVKSEFLVPTDYSSTR